MKKSNQLIFFIYTCLTFSPLVVAEATGSDYCDQLRKRNVEQRFIDSCVQKYGKSDTVLKDESRQKENAEKEAEEEKQIANLEEKQFSADDLLELTFGVKIIATEQEYDEANKAWEKETQLTESETVCRMLGYEKAREVVLDGPYYQKNKINVFGAYVPKSILNYPLNPVFFDLSSKPNSQVKFFNSISCVKRKDTNVIGSWWWLKRKFEFPKVVSGRIDSKVNDGARNTPKPAVDQLDFGKLGIKPNAAR